MNNENQKYNIDDLASFMEIAKEENKEFVFVTGAGCSVTAGIPLAWQIVEELNREFELQLKPLSKDERSDYGKCMECIEITKRRDYLKRYIDESKINWAHIALACLLKAGYIRRILTFNFDNLLARSCGLLNLYPATYDFTAANLNMYGLIDDPAIVHLHGQGHGFIQLNTQSETKEHAQQLEEFVRYTLNESPTLFIGYSGKNDAFFPQIEKQFSGQHRLFWVDKAPTASEHLKKSILRSRLANYISCDKGGADTFLILLAQSLKCFPPKLFLDPYNHMIDELDNIAGYPLLNESKNIQEKNIEDNNEDILIQTKDRLSKAHKEEVENTKSSVLEDFLKGDYQKVISFLSSKEKLSNEESLWLIRSYLNSISKNSNYEYSIRIYDKIIERFKDSNDKKIRELVANAFLDKANILNKMNRYDESVSLIDSFLEVFKDSNDIHTSFLLVNILLTKAQALGSMKKYEELITVLEYLIDNFDNKENLDVNEHINLAKIQKIAALVKLNKFDEALSTIKDISIESSFKSDENWSFYVYIMYGYIYLMKAKNEWDDHKGLSLDIKKSYEYLYEALNILNESNNNILFKPWLMGRLSYMLFLQGYKEKSKKFLFQALASKEKDVYEDLWEDINQNRILEDSDFEVLLENVWSNINLKI